jgi:hypothetical protein
MTRRWHFDYLDAKTDHLDGWCAELAEQDDGTVTIYVTGQGRIWHAERETIEAAIAVAARIIADHAGRDSLWIDPNYAEYGRGM